MIELKQVFKSYRTQSGPNVVLNGIDAVFPSLESVGILGRNGAGKSTLLRVLSGVERPDSGKVLHKGRVSWPIGFSGGFAPSLTGEENSRFIARIYGQEVHAVVGFARDFAELGRYFYEPVKNYSSGMRARLAFGLSMAIDFDTYLVDEVTAVGDKVFQDKCRDAFAERRARASVIIVSHQLSTIRSYCSRCAVLHQGHLRIFDKVADAARYYEKEVLV
jgi:capsular polysaccharide transport system ATP-binding protein